MSKGKLAIIGVGEVPTGWFPERDPWEMIYDSCMEAISDAGIDKNDVEGVVSVNPMAQPVLQSEIGFGKIPEELGLKGVKDVCIVNQGGATTCGCLRMAEQWVNSNIAKIVLVQAVTKHSALRREARVGFFATAGIDLGWEYFFGTTYNASVAMGLTRRICTGSLTEEDIAAEVVALRAWGALDPNGMNYKKPATMEDVMNSRMVTTPLRALMCNRLADGAGAMIVTTPERAEQITKNVVYKLGDAVRYAGATSTQRRGVRGRGVDSVLNEALNEAGLTVKDLDCLETILVYPGNAGAMLEMVGACEPGEGNKCVREGWISPGGKFPINTLGGAIGRGHTGSGPTMANYIEAVRQLTGRAGPRQVPDCRYIGISSAGGSGMNMIWNVIGRDIP